MKNVLEIPEAIVASGLDDLRALSLLKCELPHQAFTSSDISQLDFYGKDLIRNFKPEIHRSEKSDSDIVPKIYVTKVLAARLFEGIRKEKFMRDAYFSYDRAAKAAHWREWFGAALECNNRSLGITTSLGAVENNYFTNRRIDSIKADIARLEYQIPVVKNTEELEELIRRLVS